MTSDLTAAFDRMVLRHGRIDRIAHFAAQTAVPMSMDDPVEDVRVNLGGTVRILEYARRQDVAKVCFASSSAVYDDDAPVPVSENSRARPASPYGVDKLAGELYLDYYARLHGLTFTALRFMNVYGPRQDPGSRYSGVVSIFLDRAASGRPITIFDDGEQTRDFVYVSDVADAVIDALMTDAGNNAIVNVGTGVEVTINALARTILELTGPLRRSATSPRAPATSAARSRRWTGPSRCYGSDRASSCALGWSAHSPGSGSTRAGRLPRRDAIRRRALLCAWGRCDSRRAWMRNTLFLNPPSFEGFDGGAGSRYQARREVRSFWFPTWLAQPAAMVPGSKLIDAPPADLTLSDVLAVANDYELCFIHTSTPSFQADVRTAEADEGDQPAAPDRVRRAARRHPAGGVAGGLDGHRLRDPPSSSTTRAGKSPKAGRWGRSTA